MIVLFGILNLPYSIREPKLASGKHEAQWIILCDLRLFVRDGFLNGEDVVSIFFDLEKAYDTTSKYGIMKNLHDMDLRGRLPLYMPK